MAGTSAGSLRGQVVPNIPRDKTTSLKSDFKTLPSPKRTQTSHLLSFEGSKVEIYEPAARLGAQVIFGQQLGDFPPDGPDATA